jgi:hypothetical protein
MTSLAGLAFCGNVDFGFSNAPLALMNGSLV